MILSRLNGLMPGLAYPDSMLEMQQCERGRCWCWRPIAKGVSHAGRCREPGLNEAEAVFKKYDAEQQQPWEEQDAQTVRPLRRK
jgi:hypothetical protein